MLQSAAATLRALSAAALIVIPLPPVCRVQAPPVFGVCASSIVFAATVKLSWTKIVCAHAGTAAAKAVARTTAKTRRIMQRTSPTHRETTRKPPAGRHGRHGRQRLSKHVRSRDGRFRRQACVEARPTSAAGRAGPPEASRRAEHHVTFLPKR